MTNTITQIKCLHDLISNNKAFFGKFVNYFDGEWSLDDDKDNEYKIDKNFFNCLDENIRLFNFRYSSNYGKKHYYIEPSDLARLAYYDKFLIDLVKLTYLKSFKNLTDITSYFIDNDYTCVSAKVRFPLGIQGRYDDVKCLIIRGRKDMGDKSVFIPYYGHSAGLLPKNRIFRRLLRVFILLYRPDLDYPQVFFGDKRDLENTIFRLYQKVCEDFKNE